MLDRIDRVLEDHHRLAAKVAFERLFVGWDTRWDEAFAEWWAANCPKDELWQFGVQSEAQRGGGFRVEVVEPPFELTFSMTDDNLDAAAYQEAYQGSPTLITLTYDDEPRALQDLLADEVPGRLDDYIDRVELHLARLGLASIHRPGVPRYLQDTLWSNAGPGVLEPQSGLSSHSQSLHM